MPLRSDMILSFHRLDLLLHLEGLPHFLREVLFFQSVCLAFWEHLVDVLELLGPSFGG